MTRILSGLRSRGIRIDALFAHNDDMAIGAIAAIKDYEAGKDLPVRIITAEEVFPAEVARKVLPSRKY